MSYLPRGNAATTAEWPELVDELDRWGERGRVASLWWRDDDAVRPTSHLDELLRLAGQTPVALAVIPAFAEPELAAALRCNGNVAVLQHGWQHTNRAVQGKKCEYPETRPCGIVAAELAAGRARLHALFGPQFLSVFVPPWNRIADRFLPLLPDAGLIGLSAMVPSKSRASPLGLAVVDVNVDLVDWHGGGGFVGSSTALSGLIGHLRKARSLPQSSPVPIGIMTHHLVMDPPTAAFLERLIPLIEAHAAARWTGIGEFLP